MTESKGFSVDGTFRHQENSEIRRIHRHKKGNEGARWLR